MIQKAKIIFHDAKLLILGFLDKELTLFAASLSFYTIFAIIPLLLIVLSLITSLPSFSAQYHDIRLFIFSNIMPGNSEAIMKYIDGFLKNSVQMGVISFVSVLVASLLFFQNFEYIVNKIFNAPKRTIWEYITVYWTLVTLTPIALGLSFFVSSKLAAFLGESQLLAWINLLKFFSYLIIWALFFLIYQISANTKIMPKASLVASFIVSLVFVSAKTLFVYYVLHNKTYTTMYGSFSIIIFLFLWIYISWIIFIYGMKLCHILDTIYKEKKGKQIQTVKEDPKSNSQK